MLTSARIVAARTSCVCGDRSMRDEGLHTVFAKPVKVVVHSSTTFSNKFGPVFGGCIAVANRGPRAATRTALGHTAHR